MQTRRMRKSVCRLCQSIRRDQRKARVRKYSEDLYRIARRFKYVWEAGDETGSIRWEGLSEVYYQTLECILKIDGIK